MATPFYAPPINYGINVASPFEQAVQGLKLGATVADIEAQRNQAQLKAQQQQQLLAQQQLAMAEQQRFFGLDNPTIKDLMRYSAYIPPEQANAMRQQFELLGKDRAQANLARGAQVLSAVVAGRPDLSISLLEESRDATQDPAEKKVLQSYIDMGKSDPSALFKIISVPMMTSEEGRKLVAGIESSQAAARAEAKAGPELDRLKAEVQIKQTEAATIAEEKRLALARATSDAETARIQAQFAERERKAALALKAAQADAARATAEKARRPDAESTVPTITQIQDPTDPNRMITIDARRYQGGGMGSPGVIGASGKTAPAAAAETKKVEGQAQARDIIDTLRTAYQDLDLRRAIPSDQRNAISNTLSYIASTGAGQVAGRMAGTKEQTQRDIIQGARNQLLNAVKNATGMSAQQLNSNVEFRSWLESLTDPTKSIQANEKILENLETFIAGGGKKMGERSGAPAGGTQSGATVSNW